MPRRKLKDPWLAGLMARRPIKVAAVARAAKTARIIWGLDVVTVSRRLGHASPVVTLTVYAHLFHKTDVAAASAIEAAMRTGKEQ